MKTETRTSIKAFFRKYGLLLICVVIILILTGYCVRLESMMREKPIVGTYMIEGLENIPVPSDTLVFSGDGTYVIYRQLEPIKERGTYKKEEELVRLQHDGEEDYLVCVNQVIYDVRNDTVKKFVKVSDTGVFINVDP